METSTIERAKPVWVTGSRPRFNDTVGFRASFPSGSFGKLRVATSLAYRAFLNGEFLAHGTARCAKGHFRVDEIDLAGRLRPVSNVIAIEVICYGANAFSHINQAPFLQAEVVIDGVVVASTGGGFEAVEAPG